jgi:hypothetical protein
MDPTFQVPKKASGNSTVCKLETMAHLGSMMYLVKMVGFHSKL